MYDSTRAQHHVVCNQTSDRKLVILDATAFTVPVSAIGNSEEYECRVCVVQKLEARSRLSLQVGHDVMVLNTCTVVSMFFACVGRDSGSPPGRYCG